jgi:Zn-dependent peptidase ImmA (M78 family)
MILRRPRYSHIKRIVASLLLENGIHRAPVAVETLAGQANIEVRYGDLGETSGLLVRKKGATIIGVNSAHLETRQRFTIAHEFGHFLLHEGLEAHVDRDFRVAFRDKTSSDASSVIEIEANFFAANLLMPEDFLNGDGAETAIDHDEEVAKLARKYKVSRHAMSLRLTNIYNHLRPY